MRVVFNSTPNPNTFADLCECASFLKCICVCWQLALNEIHMFSLWYIYLFPGLIFFVRFCFVSFGFCSFGLEFLLLYRLSFSFSCSARNDYEFIVRLWIICLVCFLFFFALYTYRIICLTTVTYKPIGTPSANTTQTYTYSKYSMRAHVSLLSLSSFLMRVCMWTQNCVLFIIFVSFITEITEIIRVHASQHKWAWCLARWFITMDGVLKWFYLLSCNDVDSLC